MKSQTTSRIGNSSRKRVTKIKERKRKKSQPRKIRKEARLLLKNWMTAHESFVGLGTKGKRTRPSRSLRTM